jgi:DNA modification methylase
MDPAIEIWPISRFRPYEKNPRKNDHVIDQMVASIREFGFKIPILARSDGEVVDGHLRLKAAVKLGLAELPAILCDEWTPAQVKAFRVMVNKSVEWADWDADLLNVELLDLKEMDFDLGLTGFDVPEVDGLLEQTWEPPSRDLLKPPVPEVVPPVPPGDEDAQVALPVHPVSEPGDTWVLGDHRLMCGDSTSIDAVDGLLVAAKADLIFTDPPYGVQFQSGMSKGGTATRFDPLMNDDAILDVVPIIESVLRDNAAAFIWTSHQVYPHWRSQFDAIYKHTIIWHKPGGGIGDLHGNYATDYEMCLFCVKGRPEFRGKRGMAVWTVGKDRVMEYLHPTQKPVALAERAIADFSDAGDLVLDLFGGSGLTLIAAEKTGRRARLMELDPKYVDVIVKRWQEYTGKTATLDGDGRTFDEIAGARVPVAA